MISSCCLAVKVYYHINLSTFLYWFRGFSYSFMGICRRRFKVGLFIEPKNSTHNEFKKYCYRVTSKTMAFQIQGISLQRDHRYDHVLCY
jgi:hypothetical protein